MIRISSKDNPLIKTIRLVSTEARRAPEDLVVVEGLRALEEASALTEVKSVLVSESFGRQPREQNLLELWTASQSTRIYIAPDWIVASASQVRTSQGAVALARMARRNLADVPETPNPLLLCACGIQDPGNLGTLIRAGAAAGATLICTTAASVSARNPKVIRASAGTCFRTTVVESVSSKHLLDFCRGRSIDVYAAAPTGRATCFETDLAAPAALLLGNEANGFDPEEWPGVPALRIPMVEGVESLNVAAAGAILLFEAYRQRTASANAAKKEPKP
jgi:RNA methyltransferase, TrmH family